MKNIIIVVLLVVGLLVGCGKSYDSIIGITPMDDIMDKSKKSTKNIFDNLSAVFASDSSV